MYSKLLFYIRGKCHKLEEGQSNLLPFFPRVSDSYPNFEKTNLLSRHYGWKVLSNRLLLGRYDAGVFDVRNTYYGKGQEKSEVGFKQ